MTGVIVIERQNNNGKDAVRLFYVACHFLVIFFLLFIYLYKGNKEWLKTFKISNSHVLKIEITSFRKTAPRHGEVYKRK